MHVYNTFKHIVQTLVLAIQGHYSCMYIMHTIAECNCLDCTYLKSFDVAICSRASTNTLIPYFVGLSLSCALKLSLPLKGIIASMVQSWRIPHSNSNLGQQIKEFTDLEKSIMSWLTMWDLSGVVSWIAAPEQLLKSSDGHDIRFLSTFRGY